VLIALHVLLWIIAILLILFVLVLATPLRLRLSFRSDPGRRSCVDVGPLGGVIGNVRVFDSTRKKAAKKDKAPTKKTRKLKGRRTARAGAVLELPDVVGRMIQTIHVEELAIDGEFGLDDPADTGRIYGQLTPLIYGTSGRVHLQPNFQSACLRGTADAHLRVIPIALLWPLAGFLWRMFGSIK
jgi:hypothetical protein